MYGYSNGPVNDPEKALKWLALNLDRMSQSDLYQYLMPCFKTQKALQEWIKEKLKDSTITSSFIEDMGLDISNHFYFLNSEVRLRWIIEHAREKNLLGEVAAVPQSPGYLDRSKHFYWHDEPDFDLMDFRNKWLMEVLKSLVRDVAPVIEEDYSEDELLCDLTLCMLAHKVFRERYSKFLCVLPTAVLLRMASGLSSLLTTIPSYCDPKDVVDFVRQIPACPNPIINLFEQALMLNTHLLPGNISAIHDMFDDGVHIGVSGEFMLGAYWYLQRNPRESLVHFNRGLRMKPAQKKYIGEPVLDLIYVSALLSDDSIKSQKALMKIMDKKVYDEYGYQPVIILIRALKSENVEKAVAALKKDMDQYEYTDLDILVSCVVLIHLDELSPDDSLMAEYRRIIANTPQLGFLSDHSFLPPYTKPKKWESTINVLMNKLGYSEAGSRKTPAENGARVAYLLYDNLSLQPLLQKTRDGVTWSKGRNIAMGTFKNGIPEMTELDMAVASKMKVNKGWYGALSYQLGGEDTVALLAGSQSVFCGNNPDIRIDIVREEPYLVISKVHGGFRVDSNINPKDINGKNGLHKENVSLYKIYSITTRQKEIIKSLNGVTFPQESEGQMKNLMSFLAKDIQVHSDIVQDSDRLEEVEADARITAVLQPRDGSLALDLYSKPFTDVSPYLVPAKGNVSVMSKRGDVPVRTVRKLKAEKENLDAVIAALEEIFPEEDLSDTTSFVCEELQDSLSVLDAFNSLKDSVRIEWPEGCKFKIGGSADVKDFNISIHSHTNWFEVEGEVKVSDEKILQLSEVLDMYRRRKGRFIEMADGEYLALTEKLRRQIEMIEAYSSSDKGKLKMPKVAASAITGIEKSGVEVTEDAALKKLLKKVKAAEKEEYDTPEDLRADLRDYQTEGYRWMCRLAAWGAGACLADDMGLGKTVQTLAVLLRRAQEGPALIVAPASVMPNWQRESERFTPSLKFTVLNALAESDRKDVVTSASVGDVILTTYGVLASDAELVQSITWSTAVLDEAHVIKNKDTKQSAACMALSADFRVILTGTPLQNNLAELWNLFQFINPGILGTFGRFKEHFLTPIQEHKDKEVQKQLKRLIQPFILRRTKADVLDELPQKTEQVLYVELSENEMALYESVRQQAELELSLHQSSLVKTISDILKLRQIVCSPALVGAEIAGESSKIKELMRLVPELISGQHRALVFSQFTSFLALVKKALDDEGIQYMYLDGSTPIGERQRIVKKFQKGDYPLFLISLKAGGLGLNLTAADYIIHLDPWWNPAVEDQASDRAYRIGQTKPVTVYKLIAQNTIEEKIVALHKSKKSLADSLLEGSDVSAKLSREELLELLGHK